MSHRGPPKVHYGIAVAPGILDDGTYCVVIYDPDHPVREILVEGQIESKDAALRVAERYRERCASPGFLAEDLEIEIRERSYSCPPFLHGLSPKELETSLIDHIKEGLSYLEEFKLSQLYQTPLLWSIAALIVYYFNWQIEVPSSLPFAEQILGSDKIGRVQLACVFPTALALKYLAGRVSMGNHLAKEAMSAELITTLACKHGWGPERFRKMTIQAVTSSRARGLVRRLGSAMNDGQLERFNKSMPSEKKERTPHEFQQASFERYIHAMTFLREEPDFAEKSFRVPSAARLAGDFQVPQLEQRLSYLSDREQRELRYRVRAAAERHLERIGMRVWRIAILPFYAAIAWSLWISGEAATWLFVGNLLIALLLVYWNKPYQFPPSAIPRELFRHQVFLGNGMAFYYKIIRFIPRPTQRARSATVTVISESKGPPNDAES